MALSVFSVAPKWVSSLFWLCFLAGAINASPVQTDLRSLLLNPTQAWDANTTISFPGSGSEGISTRAEGFSNRSAFLDATERWTLYEAPTFSAAISPGTQRDVVKIIKLATKLKIPFLVTGRRHGYSTSLGQLQNGLAIDLSRMTSIDLNVKAGTLTIGPGVRAGDLFDPLYEAGFELQTGSASCPSFIGVTIGGGVGRMTGVHGLVLDALISATLVTATGEVVEVSKKRNPDLFWAIRGSGANFGVITSATFKLSKQTNNGDVLTADFIFPAEKSAAYFDLIETMNDKLPAELASITLAMWNEDTNATVVGANWVYLGPEEQGMEVLQPFIELGPAFSDISVVPWNKLVATAGGGVEPQTCADGLMRDLYSFNIKNYSSATYQASFLEFADFHAQHPNGRASYLQWEFFPNQAMAAVPSSETSWPWRDATGYVNVNMVWDVDQDDTIVRASNELGLGLRSKIQETSGYPEPSVFMNYARGDETLEQIFTKENLPRLAKLKRRWDPRGVFSYNQGLPTHYP